LPPSKTLSPADSRAERAGRLETEQDEMRRRAELTKKASADEHARIDRIERAPARRRGRPARSTNPN